jgi:hypothetical protein
LGDGRGVSEFFPVLAYQAGAGAEINQRGRQKRPSSDVSGNADSDTGYLSREDRDDGGQARCHRFGLD